MARKTKSPLKSQSGYLHGYTSTEQERLVKQAKLYEPAIYSRIQWPEGTTHILEPGCGVGAQTDILLRRWPRLHVTGVDRSEAQLKKARAHLKSAIANKRATLVQSEGEQLPFEDSRFHGAFVCWLLEHVKDPVTVLKEIHRTLQPGAVIYCTEVMNQTFFLHPYAPATLQYWFAFNDHQWNMGGDPFLGAKLGNHLLDAGFQSIQTETHTYQLDKRIPKQREQHMKAWFELLMSGAPSLISAKRVTQQIVDGMEREWAAAMKDPNAVLYYSFIQARAVAL